MISEQVNDFLDCAARAVLDLSPRIVGFTSVFQQNVASLALAAELKRRDPTLTVVFGGANCEAEMGRELIRQFDQVDYVVSGEGDDVFPALVAALLNGGPVELAGVLRRGSSTPRLSAEMVRDMDRLPYPDYTEYFAQLREHDITSQTLPRLLFETARGCWWGEKQHCTFCGLNGTSMPFRSKSSNRALDELRWLTTTYPGHAVSVVDNILDMRYFRDFIPRVAELGLDVELFYEVKANLKKEQLRLLRSANITRLQPGIESLHDSVLRLMRKGVSAFQNVQTLKWCAELGIRPHWNLIWGFPREEPEAYREMAELIPLLRHLPPPESSSCIRLDRFSPNFFDAQALGIRDVRPFPAYDFIYPFAPEVKANLAYYFTFQYEGAQDVNSYTSAFASEVERWQSGSETYCLFSISVGEQLTLWDFRDLGDEPLIVLSPLQRRIYLFCDSVRTAQEVCQLCGVSSETAERDVNAELERMVKRKVMVRDGSRYLSLALSGDEYTPPMQGLRRMQEYIASKAGDSSGQDETVIDLSPHLLV
jgi:ribosomal peptide maturation radical SAM protein 1